MERNQTTVWRRVAPATCALVAGLACGGAEAQSASATDDFFGKAKAGVMLRSSYFERTKPIDTDPHPEAWGVGGWLWGETGELNQMFSLGGAYNFVGKAYSPADGGGSFILDDQNTGYGVLGEAWGRLRFGDRDVSKQAYRDGSRSLPDIKEAFDEVAELTTRFG